MEKRDFVANYQEKTLTLNTGSTGNGASTTFCNGGIRYSTGAAQSFSWVAGGSRDIGTATTNGSTTANGNSVSTSVFSISPPFFRVGKFRRISELIYGEKGEIFGFIGKTLTLNTGNTATNGASTTFCNGGIRYSTGAAQTFSWVAGGSQEVGTAGTTGTTAVTSEKSISDAGIVGIVLGCIA